MQEANAGRYLSTTCPICLDDFEPKPPTPSAPQLPEKGDKENVTPEATETTSLLGVKARSTDADHSLADALPLSGPSPSAPPEGVPPLAPALLP